jgi:hypothetical protein
MIISLNAQFKKHKETAKMHHTSPNNNKLRLISPPIARERKHPPVLQQPSTSTTSQAPRQATTHPSIVDPSDRLNDAQPID